MNTRDTRFRVSHESEPRSSEHIFGLRAFISRWDWSAFQDGEVELVYLPITLVRVQEPDQEV